MKYSEGKHRLLDYRKFTYEEDLFKTDHNIDGIIDVYGLIIENLDPIMYSGRLYDIWFPSTSVEKLLGYVDMSHIVRRLEDINKLYISFTEFKNFIISTNKDMSIARTIVPSNYGLIVINYSSIFHIVSRSNAGIRDKNKEWLRNKFVPESLYSYDKTVFTHSNDISTAISSIECNDIRILKLRIYRFIFKLLCNVDILTMNADNINGVIKDPLLTANIIGGLKLVEMFKQTVDWVVSLIKFKGIDNALNELEHKSQLKYGEAEYSIVSDSSKYVEYQKEKVIDQ